MQANFGWVLLEHALNPELPGSPEGPQPDAEWASVPRGAGGHGGRILGASWVLGKCMAYQVPGRAWAGRWVGWAFGVAAVPPPASLPLWILGWLLGGKQAARPGWSPSHPRRRTEASSLAWTRRRPSPRLCRQDPLDQAWPAPAPRPLSPGSKGSRGLEQCWLAGIGPAAPWAVHPSTIPLLHACKAAWPHGENGTGLACPTARQLHHAPGPSSASGSRDPAGLGAGGVGPRKQEEWL